MRLVPASLLACLVIAPLFGQESSTQIRLPRHAVVSPDGAKVAFNWQDDLWVSDLTGENIRRLTVHPAKDEMPVWTPDGQHLVFRSDRTGGRHLYRMPLQGGSPQQLSVATTGDTPLECTADGLSVLVLRRTDRDYHWSESSRVFLVALDGKSPDRMLLDVGAADASLSPDGSRLLFTRGRAAWQRKGYKGAAAMQLWVADLSQSPITLRRLDEDRENYQNVSHNNPMWSPDGKTAYFTSDPDGTMDLYSMGIEGGAIARLTTVSSQDQSDDGVVFPSLAKNGQTFVFRRGFDLHKWILGGGDPEPVVLATSLDSAIQPIARFVESKANSVAFTTDGKQMAFVAGNDIYAMDRILKEPVRITETHHRESELLFSADGKRLFFVSDAAGEVDIWEATHTQPDGIWWLAEDFALRRLTDDAEVERSLALSPKGQHVAYCKGTNLHIMDEDGSDHRRVVEAWDRPDFDWSPDGRWLVYTTNDDNYNPDAWIVRIDGTREPYNLSRHPDWDFAPRWSPDGTRIAFISRRDGDEADVYYINLMNEEEEQTERDRKLEEARKAMEKKDPEKKGPGKKGKDSSGNAGKDGGLRGGKKAIASRPGAEPPSDPQPVGPNAALPATPSVGPNAPGTGQSLASNGKEEAAVEEKSLEPENPELEIDFAGIHDRVHRISIPGSFEGQILWSPDGKTLAFRATVDGKEGLYTVTFPKLEDPKLLTEKPLRSAHWLADAKEVVGLAGSGRNGVPAAMNEKGKTERFEFSVRAARDWPQLRQIAFDQAWRAMRDRFYDPNMNNRDWEKIREKYRPVAAQCLGGAHFSELMNMMLGELNASHMGHRGSTDPVSRPSASDRWQPTTYHLGLRFVSDFAGPGLKVESVIPGGPCHLERSRVSTGEVLRSVDGVEVGPGVDLLRLLTLNQVRDVSLVVEAIGGETRELTVRPVASVRGLLYDEFAESKRQMVETLSNGKLGYLHIRGMNTASFRKMEEDLFHAGHGKEGLVIDVRFNGGGSTTDHVLTALSQPVHAITQSRGSGEGYPQDRKVYASWNKPIVLMCNEHSFSNAEILAHAVQQIGRGSVVGMRTAGGVISTGSATLLDGSSIRMPTRGWYLVRDGSDMELNGCLPDIVLWNAPGGEDVQLAKAVEALAKEVQEEKLKPKVKLTPAADLRRE